jgi:transcriptional regulator with XRE-family HTH domain
MLVEHAMAAGIGIDQPLEQFLATLGTRLKSLRSRHGWTLEQLSKLTKLSEPYLSRLEGGTRQPSLAALITLAQVYNIPIRTLLDAGDQQSSRCNVIRAGSSASRVANGLRYRAISGGGALTNLQAIAIAIPPNRHYEKFNQHDGEEWLYVLSGQVKLVFESEQHLLETGDAAHFDARTPHRLAAEGKRSAEILLVASVAPRPGRPVTLI